ncbi:MAG: hypothetical protein SFU56_16035 [Capsulimonadales bacterium]|nr:hypothetical protein [Capsulimonadales bacterium]
MIFPRNGKWLLSFGAFLLVGCQSGEDLSSKVPDAPAAKPAAERPATADGNPNPVGKKGAAPMMPPP